MYYIIFLDTETASRERERLYIYVGRYAEAYREYTRIIYLKFHLVNGGVAVLQECAIFVYVIIQDKLVRIDLTDLRAPQGKIWVYVLAFIFPIQSFCLLASIFIAPRIHIYRCILANIPYCVYAKIVKLKLCYRQPLLFSVPACTRIYTTEKLHTKESSQYTDADYLSRLFHIHCWTCLSFEVSLRNNPA